MNRVIRLSAALFYLLLFFSASGQNGDNKLSLDGDWEIIFDHNNEGRAQQWYLNEVFEQNTSKCHIEVPSCWEEVEKDYEGVAFYRTKFFVPEQWDGKIMNLQFAAVNYLSQVWINDQVVGFHEGGYTPFSFRVDKLIKPGQDNVLTMRVISPIILTDKNIDGLGRQEVPMWRGAITGGVWQSVSLCAKGKTGIRDVFIEPHIDNNSADFNVELVNYKITSDRVELHLSILSAEGEEVASKEEEINTLPGTNNIRWSMRIPNARYWSIDNPYLYKVQIEVVTKGAVSDKWESKFGLREFTVKNDKFCLNGKPLYLKASFFEGLYPVKLAYPDSRAMAVKEIMMAKNAGFNMIRPWRKPAPEMWLDLCDSLGMLTVGSLVVECMRRPVSTPRLSFVVENELRKTILNNRNRTCIVQWELFNEINRPILSQMLNSMSVLARELDPTRMILDESGGWGEGANIYLPYERTPHKFNDIHHYSGSQVPEKEFNGYLAIAKTKEQIKQLGLGSVRGYGRNVVSGMMSYVSEMGYGSMPDLTSVNKEFQKKGNPIVAPTIYHRQLDEGTKSALKKVGFDKIYPDVQAFYLEQQKMHGIANKRMLEAVRCNDDVKGYCVHALVGGDWVIGAGLLDLWRNPKTLVYSMTKEANQKQIAPIRILPRNVYAEKGANIEISGVNELLDDQVRITVKIVSRKGRTVYKKEIKKRFVNGISTLFSTKLDTRQMEGCYTVKVEVKNSDDIILVKNEQPFDVFTQMQLNAPKAKIAVFDPENSLSAFLNSKCIEFVPFSPQLDKNIPVFVGKTLKNDTNYKTTVEQVRNFVRKGGYAVFLQVKGKAIPQFERHLEEVETDKLPLGAQLHGKWSTVGGWAGKSHIVTKHPVFKGLPTKMIMHGVYENVHPISSMSKQKGKYIVGLIGYDHFPNNDIMVRHYNGPGEVWWSADVLEADLGKGQMLLSTLQIVENLGEDPVAEKILFNMIEYAKGK